MTGRQQEAHAADCALCQGQITSPQPFRGDLCHFSIRPGDDYGDLEPVQCPHPHAGGQSRLCERHLYEAAQDYARITGLTAPSG